MMQDETLAPTDNGQEETCDRCDEPCEDFVDTKDGDVCNKCANEDYFACYDCQELCQKDDEQYVNGDSMCPDCYENYATCDDCGHTIHQDDSSNVCDRIVCDDCRSDNYSECYGCSYEYHTDDMSYCDSCDNWYCEDCNCDCDNGNQNYSERDVSETFTTGKKAGAVVTVPVFVGCELEAEYTGNGDDYRLNDHLPSMCGIASDGSLKNGVEIQTPPCSLDAFEKMVHNTTETLRAGGYDIRSTCGLHVHLNAKELEAKQIRDFIRLYMYMEGFVYSVLPKSRKTGTYCKPLNETFDQKGLAKCETLGDIERYWYELTNNWQGATRNHLRETDKRFQRVFDWDENEKEEAYFKSLEPVIEQYWEKNYHEITKRLKSDKWNQSRYFGVNMQSYFFRGTIELRHHSGTLNATKILNWVQFNLLMLEQAGKNCETLFRKMERTTDALARFRLLAKATGMSKDTIAYLLDRRKHFAEPNVENSENYKEHEPQGVTS